MGLQKTPVGHLTGAAPVANWGVVDFEHDVVANEYGFYCVPHDFRGREVPEILASGGVYEPATLRLMARILRRGGDVVTGGTFIGDFLPALSEALTPGALVHTFEPNPLARNAARYTIALNDLNNIEMHGCAVGEKSGKLHLQIAKSNGASMAARAKIVESSRDGETVSVDVRKLDTLVGSERPVALLHLDVEGHELAAVLGAQKMIRTHTPCLIIEAEKAWKQRNFEREINKLFPQAGYRIAGSIERNAIFMPQAPVGAFRAF